MDEVHSVAQRSSPEMRLVRVCLALMKTDESSHTPVFNTELVFRCSF